MRNNKRQKSIFDAFFGDSLFNDSFFSMSRMDFSFPKFSLEDSEFPAEGDSNFNKTEENIETETHSIKKEVWTSVDGAQKFERVTSRSKAPQKSLQEPTKADIKLLLDKAVEEQDFEEAIKLRDKLKELDK